MKLLHCALAFAITFIAASADSDVTAKYQARDFSSLLVPRSEFLGYIGPNYQRLKIHFTAVMRDETDPTLYHVTGTSQVKANRCDFAGTITLLKITAMEKSGEAFEEYKGMNPLEVGTFSARYDFRENPAQNASGVFAGVMSVDWYVSAEGKLFYDDVMDAADSYRNNQYKGLWTPYGDATGTSKVANWGEYRIPDSAELDYGAGEFMPNPKYKHNGWDDYNPAH